MAHRGHDWPLAFRRDWNINERSYQHKLAERYDVLFQTFAFSGAMARLNGRGGRSGKPTDSDRTMYVWNVSGAELQAPYRLELRISMAADSVTSMVRARFYSISTGLRTLEWAMANDGTHSTQFTDLWGGHEIFRDPIHCPNPAALGGSNCRPAHYPGH